MKIAISILFLIFQLTLELHSAERVVTKKISDVKDFVSTKKEQLGANQILVIFDFDNTLMAMKQDLGSDQWYYWQADAIKRGDKKEAMVSTMQELFDLQYKLYALGDMHAVESNTAKVVNEIQSMKIKTIIMTSRGPEYRSDVEAELERINLSFKENAIGPESGYAGTYLPKTLDTARSISYQNGILMGSGQNKAKLLRELLEKTQTQFKMIVFVDDSLKNIEHLEAEFSDDKNMTLFFYTHEEERVKKFEKDKTQVLKHWKKLKPVLDFYKSKEVPKPQMSH